jgi:hypothetical protein
VTAPRIAILDAGAGTSTVPAMLSELLGELLLGEPVGLADGLPSREPPIGLQDAGEYDAVLLTGAAQGPGHVRPSIMMHSHRVTHPRLSALRLPRGGRSRVDILWVEPRDPRPPSGPEGCPAPTPEALFTEAFTWAARDRRSRVTLAEPAEGDPSFGPLGNLFERVASRHPGIRAERLGADALPATLREGRPTHQVLVFPLGAEREMQDVITSLLGGVELAARGEFRPGMRPVFSAAARPREGLPTSIGTLVAVGLLLEYLGDMGAAELVWRGVERAFDAGVVPVELGGSSTTEEVVWWISQQVPILRRLSGRGSGT